MGDVQIQGAILDDEDMTFDFSDSFSSWTYEDLQEIEEETLANTTTKTASPQAAGSLEVERPSPFLPDGLWLMDIGCGHDLINDRLADGLEVVTLKKQGRLVFATANGRIESRNVVPVFCRELTKSLLPTSCVTLRRSCRLESDASNKVTPFIGKLAETPS